MLLDHADRNTDSNDAARLGAQPIHHLVYGLCLGQHRLGMAVDSLAHFDHREPASGTLQQAYSKARLQLAERRLRCDLGIPSARSAAATPAWSTTTAK